MQGVCFRWKVEAGSDYQRLFVYETFHTSNKGEKQDQIQSSYGTRTNGGASKRFEFRSGTVFTTSSVE